MKKVGVIFLLIASLTLVAAQIEIVDVEETERNIINLVIPDPPAFNNITGNTNSSVFADIWVTFEGLMDDVLDLFPTFFAAGFLNDTQNIDISPFNITAGSYFGDGQYLTGIQHGQLTMFLHDENSDVPGSKDLSYARNDTATTTISVSVTVTDQTIQNWTSEVDTPSLELLADGIVAYHFHARKTAGGTKDIKLYFTLYYTNSSGGESTVIATTEHSDILTTDLASYVVHCSHGATILENTDRLTIQLFAELTGAGGNPTLEFQIEGDTASRIELPSPSPTRELFIPYTGARFNLDYNFKNISNVDSVNTTTVYGVGSGTGDIFFRNGTTGELEGLARPVGPGSYQLTHSSIAGGPGWSLFSAVSVYNHSGMKSLVGLNNTDLIFTSDKAVAYNLTMSSSELTDVDKVVYHSWGNMRSGTEAAWKAFAKNCTGGILDTTYFTIHTAGGEPSENFGTQWDLWAYDESPSSSSLCYYTTLNEFHGSGAVYVQGATLEVIME